MSTIFARKNGRVYNVYETPVDSWDNPPDDFLVNTFICETDSEFKALFPGKDVVITTRPESPNKAYTEPKPSLASMLAVAASMNLPKEAQEALKKRSDGSTLVTVHGVGGGVVRKVREASEVLDKAILEYRLAAARKSSNLPVLKKFILKLWPDVGDELAKVEEQEDDSL